MTRLVVAALATGFASVGWAQSSVTVSGVVDAMVQHGKGSVADRTRLGSGGVSSSRLIFRGTEDLGGGASASFWLEAGVNADDGTGVASNANNQTTGAAAGGTGIGFNRRSTVSLANVWGELRLGRDYVAHYLNVVTYDPFGNLGAGASMLQAASIGGLTAVRASNSVGYLTPSVWGGLSVQYMHYTGENLSNAVNSDDGSGDSVRVRFGQTSWNVAIAYGMTKYAAGEVRFANLGGEYDFGLVRLQAVVAQDRNGPIRADGFLVGAVAPFGPQQLKAAYSTYDTTAAGSPRTRKLALGYVYNMSKRTALYSTIAYVRNSGGARLALNGAVTGPNASSTGLDIGMRHAF